MTTGSRTEHILTAPERLDLDTCDTFRRDATELVDSLRQGGGRLVVDMRATRHVDSAGLRALLLVRRRAALGGIVVGLRGPSAEIQGILLLTRTAGLFEMEAAEPA